MPGGERTETEAQTWGSQLLWLLYLCFCFRTSVITPNVPATVSGVYGRRICLGASRRRVGCTWVKLSGNTA